MSDFFVVLVKYFIKKQSLNEQLLYVLVYLSLLVGRKNARDNLFRVGTLAKKKR